MTKPILVCGCSRSGNTLMAFLIGKGYKSVHRIARERNPVKYPDDNEYDWVVGKRPRSILTLRRDLSRDSYKRLHIVMMIRDVRDVITSRHYGRDPNRRYVPLSTWIEAAKNIEYAMGMNKKRFIVVRFEDLIMKPEEVQDTIADQFEMKKKVPFGECYKYFSKKGKMDTWVDKTMGGNRPLDSSVMHRWKRNKKDKKFVLSQMKKGYKRHAKLRKYVEMFGYTEGETA